MGTCRICGRQMMTAEGCVEHQILLNDGSVVPSPIHGEESSLHNSDERCHDCGAEPGGIHHASCDSARKPDGSQILIDAVAYWDPDSDPDPRSEASDYIFLVVLQPVDDEDGYPQEPTPHTPFDSLDKAEAYVEQEEWGEFEIQPMRVQTEVPEP